MEEKRVENNLLDIFVADMIKQKELQIYKPTYLLPTLIFVQDSRSQLKYDAREK